MTNVDWWDVKPQSIYIIAAWVSDLSLDKISACSLCSIAQSIELFLPFQQLTVFMLINATVFMLINVLEALQFTNFGQLQEVLVSKSHFWWHIYGQAEKK